MKTVIIIGAGPAGLTAASELLKNHPDDYRVIILEGSQEIGGISRTVRYHGNRMDIGGHRFFSKNPEIMKWWSELMPLQGSPALDDRLLSRKCELAEGGPDPDQEDTTMLVRTRISRIYYLKKFFDYPVSLKWSLFRNMGFLRTMQVGFSYLKSLVVKKPEDSLENFYINRFGKKLYSMFFDGYTTKVWGRSPKQISPDWGSQRVKGLSVFAMLKDMLAKAFGRKNAGNTETSLIEQFWYPKFGPGQLWELAAEQVANRGAILLKNHEVVQIHEQDGKIISVTCKTPSGMKTLEGDYFLSSMPIKDLVEGFRTSSPIPKDVVRVASGLPYRDFVTVGLLVPRMNLKNETDIPTLGSIVPDCWIYVQDTNVKLGRIQIFNNWSPYMVQDPQHTVWIGLEYFCSEQDDFWNLSEEETVRLAAEELVRIGVLSDASVVMDSHREQVRKAYPAYFDTYNEIQTVIDYLNQFENLFCIGRNGQHRYNNMDHSMLTAMEAAKCIMNGKTDKHALWNVNTEKEYHEEK